jgi:excinuclease UvrABC nuclease subunit
MRLVYKIIRRIFPFRDGKCMIGGKPCFSYQLGLCPGVCIGEVSKTGYRAIIRHIALFLSGRTASLKRQLEREMMASAKAMEFEKAELSKRQIFALEHIDDVALMNRNFDTQESAEKRYRIEAYDIAHLSGQGMVGVMVATVDGLADKSQYRKFLIHGQRGADDTRALAQVLERRMKHREWPWPDLIVVDGSTAQYNTAKQVVLRHSDIPIVAVTKDERHRPKEIKWFDQPQDTGIEQDILLANAEAHRFAISFHKARRGRAFLSRSE